MIKQTKLHFVLPLFIITLLFACSDSKKQQRTTEPSETTKDLLFTSISSEYSGINFTNTLEETVDTNYYQYMYAYVGGGVAAADFNNDGLEDLFFISNSFENKLYLNKGKLKFEDITEQAGITKRTGFDTGVTVVDINNDGYLDIYIVRGGSTAQEATYANMLYINNGDLSFTERAEEFGLADTNRGIHATFFDYDKDGDLDVYISNTPDMTTKTEVLDLKAIQTDPETIARKGSDKLYNNDGTGHFTDVSTKSGIMPDLGFGLHPQVGDLNNDGWLDIYVCNDFNMPDFVYINNQDGTFSEKRNETVKHMSFNSMGGDMADINNDGLEDILTLDMNPQDYIRSKTTMGMTSIPEFEKMVASNYHYQYMHNMLQLNNGNGTFSEISQLAGIGNTDWSWAILSADFDLDGYNDVYVTNGVFRDVIDKDKNNEIKALLRQNNRKPTKEDFLTYSQMLPQQKLVNYLFKNNGDLTFTDESSNWVDATPTFSNGAVYSDLDNDGDLELVVNNINEHATILKNNAIEQTLGNYLQLHFKGPKDNSFGLGTVANLYFENGDIQTRQLVNSKGFISSVSNTLHFGLAKKTGIEKLEIIWMDGKKQVIDKPTVNQVLTVDYANSSNIPESQESKNTIFTEIPFDYRHVDPYYNDFNTQILLPHKLSQTGPAVAVADLNGDGYDDVYLGGGHSQPGQLLLSNSKGGFSVKTVTAFENDKQYEDVGAVFFDTDQDGDLDLYVVSGSYEFVRTPKLLLDRLYINDGAGKFSKSNDALPDMVAAGSVVKPYDYDQDGDIDLFVGGRVIPNKYPYAPKSYILQNNQGKFTVVTPTIAPELEQIGMVTDAVWEDMNGDSILDLLVTGEWMGIHVFINENRKLTKSTNFKTLEETTGWWNRLYFADVDQDGDKDLIAGNLGLNYKFHATKEKPFQIYTKDFDFNGTEDIMLAKYDKDKQVPIRGKGCTAQQMPHLAKKIKSYEDFASRDLAGIVGEGIKSAYHLSVNEFRSGVFKNNGDGNFVFEPFENTLQQSPINGIAYHDFNGDTLPDILCVGNNYMSEVETTKADAGIGTLLLKNPDSNFHTISNLDSGFFAPNDTRNVTSLKSASGDLILVVNNNNKHQLFKIN
ncbi:VCBS repeat-containing protein [Tamlana sp. 2_MG-2023]|uniref:VCBS repeat-containing protein n=1 Tax=unclassified Tamlana TaxID=2614803 RepID=UPI0026E2557A|nr:MULTISPECIES: VCBS repeat-containing protein [unclassified Tamlana]MDO6761292.1 VCBS repeat-containing protein [Tamlana sp. 2_MG-2023]MDO6791775.1 VCBS repeat-containing protein [Tamlana sp. 1_MG-2023]